MDIGMLWYDDTQRPLGEKITRAVEHYKTKYGAAPTVCFVNPAALKNDPEAASATAAGVQVRSARHVLVNHFWIGVGEAAARTEAKNGNGRNNGARKRKT